MGIINDIFTGDPFNMLNLTEAVNKLPQLPSKIGDMGLFTIKGITTTFAGLEERQGTVSLIQSAERGTRVAEMKHAKKQVRAFQVPHFPLYDSVKADEIVGVREFSAGPDYTSDGSSDVTDSDAASMLRTIASVLNDRLQIMKDSLDITKEYHRINALQGILLDADGSTLLNLFSTFGISQQSFQFDFTATPATPVKKTCAQICRKMLFILGGTPFTGVQIICGDNFWDLFINCPSVTNAYVNWASNTVLQTQQRNGFMFADCYWMNYTAQINGNNLVPTDQAIILPLGVRNMFSEIYAPAPFVETVNTKGRPFYAKQRVLEYETGIELHQQSNFLMLPNRPGALFNGTHV